MQKSDTHLHYFLLLSLMDGVQVYKRGPGSAAHQLPQNCNLVVECASPLAHFERMMVTQTCQRRKQGTGSFGGHVADIGGRER